MTYEAETAGFAKAVARPEGFGALLRKGFSAHGLLLGLVIAYLAAFQILGLAVPGSHAPDGLDVLIGMFTFSVPAVIFGLIAYLFIHMAAVEKPDRPLKALGRSLKAVLTDRRKMAAGLPVALALAIFMYVFTMLKSAISILVPFSWDQTFDQLDLTIDRRVAGSRCLPRSTHGARRTDRPGHCCATIPPSPEGGRIRVRSKAR